SRGDTQTAFAQLSRSLEDRIGDRRQMRVDSLQVADDVEVDGAGLDALGAALAQSGEMPLGGLELAAAHVGVGEQEATRERHVAACEYVEGQPHVVHDLAVETLELGNAFGRESIALLDL